MTEPHRDAILVQREIAATRTDLVSNVDRLRGALRRRLSLRNQMNEHPGLVAAVALVLSLPIFALAFATRAAFKYRSRGQRVQRWLSRF